MPPFVFRQYITLAAETWYDHFKSILRYFKLKCFFLEQSKSNKCHVCALNFMPGCHLPCLINIFTFYGSSVPNPFDKNNYSYQFVKKYEPLSSTENQQITFNQVFFTFSHCITISMTYGWCVSEWLGIIWHMVVDKTSEPQDPMTIKIQ